MRQVSSAYCLGAEDRPLAGASFIIPQALASVWRASLNMSMNIMSEGECGVVARRLKKYIQSPRLRFRASLC